jgi:hypothetical protein
LPLATLLKQSMREAVSALRFCPVLAG